MITIKAPKTIIKKWTTALRSGKYKKGENQLYNAEDNTYCCLGVLYDILGEKCGNKQLPKISVLKKHGITFLTDTGHKQNSPYLPTLKSTAEFYNDNHTRQSAFLTIANAIEKCSEAV